MVGRIAAIVNTAHNEHYGDKVGFFGFFDFIDDCAVAQALLTQARETLLECGMDGVRGPFNPTINDECGLLTDGFDSNPMVLMPYNPPYYVDCYRQIGLQKARELYAFDISADTTAPERIRKIAERVKRSTGIQIRNIDMRRLPEELKTIQLLYNRTLCRNWGFVPISMDELNAAAEDLKQIVDPQLVLIGERQGVPMGFSMTIPDINELMLRASRSRGIFRVLKFIWLLKTVQPKRARLTALGVDPEYRNSGLASLFYWETLQRSQGKFVGGELSWVEESNKEIIRAIEVMGGTRSKTYQVFENSL